jgi:hypothetical protein
MHGRRHNGYSRATRAVIALVVAVACLSGVAYAATRSGVDQRRGNGQRHPGGKRDDGPSRPRFIEVPSSGGILTDVQFRFHVASPPQPAGRPGPGPEPTPARWRRFQCRFEGGDWNACSSPQRFAGLEPGDHAFAVRALNRRGLAGPAAYYRWAQLAPKNFTIDSLADTLEDLMPGGPALQLPVRIGNPNPAPIEVTALTVTATPDAPGCPGNPNFVVTPSNVTPAAPLSVPAGGSVSLPAATISAPTLALRELPIDQNACQGATVHLLFSGEARG